MRHGPAVRVKRPPSLQNDTVPASLGIGELNLIAWRDRHEGLLDHAARLTAASGPGEGVVQIAGREHAEHLPGRLDKQVLAGRRALDGLDQRHPGQVS